MAGIYLHIPFCKKACYYCDFHFSTSMRLKSDLLDALNKEMEQRKGYLTETIETVYFGGGTPSLLSADELQRLFDTLHQHYTIAPGAEITLEANPDDLTPEKIKMLAQSPVNRLSIGTQSFHDEALQMMNRAHNAQEATASIKNSQDAGFDNITIDLIYGIPNTSIAQWEDNLGRAFQLEVPHLSAYCLTIEPNTAFHKFVASGKLRPMADEAAGQQFEALMQATAQQQFIHYEISNFCKEGYYSQHNSSYWKGKKYLGIGPSAHSYNHHSRQWNVAHNKRYIDGINAGTPIAEQERIDTTTAYNEYVLTALRTIWGCVPTYINEQFGSRYLQYFNQQATKFFSDGLLEQQENKVVLTNRGKLLADQIAETFFIVD